MSKWHSPLSMSIIDYGEFQQQWINFDKFVKNYFKIMLKKKTRYEDVIVKKWTSISNYLCTEEKHVCKVLSLKNHYFRWLISVILILHDNVSQHNRSSHIYVCVCVVCVWWCVCVCVRVRVRVRVCVREREWVSEWVSGCVRACVMMDPFAITS